MYMAIVKGKPPIITSGTKKAAATIAVSILCFKRSLLLPHFQNVDYVIGILRWHSTCMSH